MDKLNKNADQRLAIAKLDEKISNCDNEQEVERLTSTLIQQKSALFSEQLAKYLELAKQHNDTENIKIFETIFSLAKHNFDFGKISQKEQNYLVEKLFLPKFTKLFQDQYILEAF